MTEKSEQVERHPLLQTEYLLLEHLKTTRFEHLEGVMTKRSEQD